MIPLFSGAAASIRGTVELEKIDYIQFSELQTFDKITAAAENSDVVHQLEEVLMIWYRQIESVSCFLTHQFGMNMDKYL